MGKVTARKPAASSLSTKADSAHLRPRRKLPHTPSLLPTAGEHRALVIALTKVKNN